MIKRSGSKRPFGDACYWIENATYAIDEIAVRFHHRLVLIHPFPNGNGRHARLIADLLVMKAGRSTFSWGSANLVKGGEARQKYLERSGPRTMVISSRS